MIERKSLKPKIIKKSFRNKLTDPNQKVKIRPIIVATDDNDHVNLDGIHSYMNAYDPIKDCYKEIETPSWFRSTEPVDVSIIIPMYKSNVFIRELINSWSFDCKYTYEIIFVDDDCPVDSTNFAFDSINKRRDEIKKPIGKIIKNLVNKGYGQACNTGAVVAKGKYLIFLNADTKVTPGWIEPIVDLLKEEKVGIVGNLQLKNNSKLIDSAGSEWCWRKKLFTHIGNHSYKKNPLNKAFDIDDAPKDLLEVAEREMVTGCCFGIKADLFDYVGGFNPNFKIGYWEDTDLCLTVRELGYKVMYQPNSKIYHVSGHSGAGSHVFYDHNVKYFMNKWVNSHRIDDLLFSEGDKNPKPPVKTIVLKRKMSHGDTLMLTSILPALKKKYKGCKIYCSARYSEEILLSSPDCDEFVHLDNLLNVKFDLFYNLDACNENRPRVNMMKCYAEAVGVKLEDCGFNMKIKPIPNVELPKEYIVVHPGSSDWAGRSWQQKNFFEISQRLLDSGENVVLVGKYTEREKIPCTLDLRVKSNVEQLAWIMKNAKAFVGIDSFPMHVAQAVDLPGVAFFGSVDPACILHNKKMRPVRAEHLPCIGCHNKQKFQARATHTCDIGTQECITSITADVMWKEICKLIEDIKNENNSILG
jgi:GT2 family glycosyltransferase/ADP-heptose:LPS heptosyltransferase